MGSIKHLSSYFKALHLRIGTQAQWIDVRERRDVMNEKDADEKER